MIFRRADHRFFDELIAMFTTLAANSYAMKNHRLRVPHLFSPDDVVWFEGTPRGTNLFIGVRALPLVHSLASNTLPNELELLERPLGQVQIPSGFDLDTLKHPSERVVAGLYVSYFERMRPVVEARFGANTTGWPDVWNFGRVIRNAFAHGGQINIANPAAAPVTWRGISYGPADNGRQIFFNDIAYPEIVFLLRDLGAAV